MFRKPPYWSLLIIALILGLTATVGHWSAERSLQPRRVASLIEHDIASRLAKTSLLEQHHADVMAWMGDTSTGGNPAWILHQPFYLFAWQGDSLIAWSTNTILPQSDIHERPALYTLQSGAYYGYQRLLPGFRQGISFTILVPVQLRYPLINQYLRPSFPASELIDPRTALSDTVVKDAVPFHNPNGQIIGYVHPPPAPEMPHNSTGWLIWFWACSLLFLICWIQANAALLSKRRPLIGFAVVLFAAIVLRVLMYWLGMPFHLGNTALFSPRLYASSALLPSLGDLLLSVLAFLWVVGFAIAHPPFKALFGRSNPPALLRWLLAIFLIAVLSQAGISFIQLIRSLVIDSLIPFEGSQLFSFDLTALTGLLTASLLAIVLVMLTRISRGMLNDLLPAVPSQFAVLIIGTFSVLAFYGRDPLRFFYQVLVLWLMVVLLAQHIPRLREAKGTFRPANLFWSVLHCLLLTILVQHFTAVREFNMRKTFAEHIATRHDDALEYNFEQITPYIRSDTAITQFLRNPTYSARFNLDERLSTRYFNNNLPAYQAHIYLYDAENHYLGNQDTTSIAQFQAIANESIVSRTSPELFYRESAIGDHIYLGLIPVKDTTGSFLGTVVIDLEQKKIVNETVLPELLQPATVNQAEKAAGYSYAVYVDRKVVVQTSDYPFPFYILRDTARGEFHERRGKDFSTLIYTPDARRAVYIWRRLGTLSEILTLFSYFLTFRFILAGLLGLWRALLKWLRNPSDWKLMSGVSLRRRLQYSMMGIVLLSFLLIGIITVFFLSRQYGNSNKKKQQAMMQAVTRSIQQYMRDKRVAADVASWQIAMDDPAFRYYVESLASSQKIDINLFDNQGRLTTATQQSIYDQGLQAPLMRPDVLQRFRYQPRPLMLEEEYIGRLRYISCYAPLRAETAEVSAFINVPLFYSQKELDEQISSIIVALINLYAAAFLISSLLAVFITGWITRAFDVIIRQFGRLNLHGNELLDWPYDDEIGLLVKEYNKMVRKVEESVSALAKTEREGAWREMARQVAHEIKNPLTPMKLHIQYLQNALQSGNPNALNLAQKVSESILEQINNLTVIANEFSDFANLNKKSEQSEKSEMVDLADVLSKVVTLYTSEPGTVIEYDLPNVPVNVIVDRSQIVRIITNLMQNAVQAIPEDRTGNIKVRLHVQNRSAIIQVMDNGTGISEEAQAKLFTPYFTTKTSGTGLGLAMTRQMVEAWNGTIDYATQIGEGTTFTIRLPLAQ